MTTRVFLLLPLLVAVSGFDRSFDDRWIKFKTENNRAYINADIEAYRRGIWETKMIEIQEHNAEYERRHRTYSMQETPWDDLTYEEFIHLGEDFDVNDIHRVKRANRNGTGDCFLEEEWTDSSPYNFTSVASLPTNVDWSQKGFVSSVKNQRQCGSCWAFSAVGAIEGQVYRKTRTLRSLSPQFLVDCSRLNSGCNGGLPVRAYRDVITLKGISSDARYPYTGREGTCRRSSTGVAATIKGYRTINTKSELLNAVAYIGPISVGIQTGPKIMNIGKGVFTDCSGPVNHAVLVVGYGVYKGKKAWKIKNSWGTTWGDKGYFYMARDGATDCGIYTTASYPTVQGTIRGVATNGEVSDLGAEVSGSRGQEMSLRVLLFSACACLLLLQVNK